jgi:hypothetical protein
VGGGNESDGEGDRLLQMNREKERTKEKTYHNEERERVF